MKIIFGVEAFFPHLSGVTIVTNKLATHFGRNLNDEAYIVTANNTGELKKEFSPRGYTLIKLPAWSNPIRPTLKFSYDASKYVPKIISEINPDIIHIQDPAFVSRALAQAAFKKKIPVVITQHSNLSFPVSFLPKFMRKISSKIYGHFLVSFVNRYCTVMTTPTETMKKDILSWGVKIPIKVISNGVNLDFFKQGKVNPNFINEYGLTDFVNHPVVLYAGRLDKDKNLKTLLTAMPLVLKECDVRFLFLGKGEVKEEMINEVARLNISDKVKFIGPVPPGDENLTECYQFSSVFVIPSAIEAQSLVTMEAMATGLPVVAADGGALPELVKNEKNGFLFSPYDANALSQALVKILKDEDLRKNMSEKSLEIIASHDQKIVFQKLKDFYNEVFQG